MESEGEFTMMSTRSVNNLQPSKEGNHAPQMYSARAQNYQNYIREKVRGSIFGNTNE